MDKNILDDIPNEAGNELEDSLESIEEEKGEKDTPPDSSPNDKTEGEGSEPSDNKKNEEEENLPFHKHPRWKAINDKNKELESELSEIKGKLEGLSEATQKQKDEAPERPEWFTALYGDDDDLWAKSHVYFKQREEAMMEQLYKKINNEQTSQLEAQTKEEREAAEYVSNAIQDLKDSGEKFDTNELIAVIKEYQPTDEEGNLDFNRGLKMLKEFKKANPESNKAKRDLAASTTSTSKPTDDGEPLNTTKSLRFSGWN